MLLLTCFDLHMLSILSVHLHLSLHATQPCRDAFSVERAQLLGPSRFLLFLDPSRLISSHVSRSSLHMEMLFFSQTSPIVGRTGFSIFKLSSLDLIFPCAIFITWRSSCGCFNPKTLNILLIKCLRALSCSI